MGTPENSKGAIIAKQSDSGIMLSWMPGGGGVSNDLFKGDVNFNTTSAVSTSQNYKNNPAINDWLHIAMILNGNDKTVHLYVNGQEEENYQLMTAGLGTQAVDGTLPVIIGNSIYQSRTFNGLIDDVRIYNRALSAQEIQQLYQQDA